MNNVAIIAENLGKRYFIRHEKEESYETFQDVLISGGKKIIASPNPFDKTSKEFWALKDMNFEINKIVNKVSLKNQYGEYNGKQ